MQSSRDSQTGLDRAIEAFVRRDRLVVSFALIVVVAVSWAYVLAGAGMGMSAWDMTVMGSGALDGGGQSITTSESERAAMNESMGMPAADVAAPMQWPLSHIALMFLMWWVMMIAMMLPSASPMILLFATVNRRQRERSVAHVPTALFAVGYLVVWAVFSVIAVGIQWGLTQAHWLSDMMSVTVRPLSALLLIAAGCYQFTPLKQSCLVHCRSPLHFLSTRWRRGPGGAVRMGIEHGTFCVGCCWFLMLLLFAGGVMNVFWIGGLALFVLIEKFAPGRHWVSHLAGVVLVACGVALLL